MLAGPLPDAARAVGLSRLSVGVADVFDAGGDLDVVTARIAAVMGEAIRDESLTPCFAGRAKSFAAFIDPHRHFVVHCSVHAPGHLTEAHDHGEAWAVYGVVRGRSRYRRYRREDDAAPARATLVLQRDDELLPRADRRRPAGARAPRRQRDRRDGVERRRAAAAGRAGVAAPLRPRLGRIRDSFELTAGVSPSDLRPHGYVLPDQEAGPVS
jgi:hypothetical protein